MEEKNESTNNEENLDLAKELLGENAINEAAKHLQETIDEEILQSVLNTNDGTLDNQVVQNFADGTQVIKDEVEEEEQEELSDKDLRKLIEFATGIKDVTQEDLDATRQDDVELERLLRVSAIKASKFNYRPKKHFGVEYKKNRNKKNKQAKKSRMINRR